MTYPPTNRKRFIFHKFNEIKMYIYKYGLDPWLLNKKNQTPFGLLDPNSNPRIYNTLLQIWIKKLFHDILLNDTCTYINPSHISIFDNLKNNFDKSLIQKIIKYI